MTRLILFCSLLVCSCKKSDTQTPSAVVEKTMADPVAIVKPSRSTVDTFIVSRTRDTLFMQFDTVKQSAVLRFRGESISLQSQRTASGIRYANADFLYTEWQGIGTLKKKGKTVFTNEK